MANERTSGNGAGTLWFHIHRHFMRASPDCAILAAHGSNREK
jgi:hypothetical protein